MLKHLRRPSPATIIAAVALWFAAGGIGYAATANDNSADTTLVKKLAPTLSVLQAKRALAAPVSKVLQRKTTAALPADSQYHHYTAHCPAGYVVTGGGGYLASLSETVRNTNNNSLLLSSAPAGRTGWSVVGFDPTGSNPDTMTAYAVCAKVAAHS